MPKQPSIHFSNTTFFLGSQHEKQLAESATTSKYLRHARRFTLQSSSISAGSPYISYSQPRSSYSPSQNMQSCAWQLPRTPQTFSSTPNQIIKSEPQLSQQSPSNYLPSQIGSQHLTPTPYTSISTPTQMIKSEAQDGQQSRSSSPPSQRALPAPASISNNRITQLKCEP
jgi:hypothetical protein